MGLETIYTVLAAALLAIPIAVVIGIAVLVAAGGVIGCTRCLFAALRSEPAPEVRTAAQPAGSRYA